MVSSPIPPVDGLKSSLNTTKAPLSGEVEYVEGRRTVRPPVLTTTNAFPHPHPNPMEAQPGTSKSFTMSASPDSTGATGSMLSTWTHMPVSLPSSETPSTSRVGVGSLPGNISEVSVAKLPEERRTEVLPSHDFDEGHGMRVRGGSVGSGGVGILPGTPNESRVVLCPEERMHPEDEIYSRSKRSGGSKVNVFSRLKGEAKVIGGRIGHNERLVEEGKRMLRGSPSV